MGLNIAKCSFYWETVYYFSFGNGDYTFLFILPLDVFLKRTKTHLSRSIFLCNREHNHSSTDSHRNLERTLHRFDKGNLSKVSVKKRPVRVKLRFIEKKNVLRILSQIKNG